MPLGIRIRRKIPGILSAALVIFVMVVLFGPIVMLAVLSFDKSTIIALYWQGFTTQWYHDAWANSDLRSAVWNSLVVAVIVTVISMVLGVTSAFAITRFKFRGVPARRALARPGAQVAVTHAADAPATVVNVLKRAGA